MVKPERPASLQAFVFSHSARYRSSSKTGRGHARFGRDEEDKYVLFPNTAELLQWLASELEAGRIVYDRIDGIVCHVNGRLVAAIQEAKGLQRKFALAQRLAASFDICVVRTPRSTPWSARANASGSSASSNKPKRTWTNGKNLARQFAYYQHAYSILDRLIAMYSISAMWRQASECEQEKLAIANEAAAPAPAGAAYG
jgi:hypothetical protein